MNDTGISGIIFMLAYYVMKIKICAKYRDMLPCIFQVHRGFGLSTSAQVLDKPALA